MGGGLLRVPLFPLAGALLFRGSQLPLHIFEPRYREMVRDALAGERLIAMVQPRDEADPPGLFRVGCLGRIGACEELSDGRYNLVLDGIGRFRIVREVEAGTAYRQAEIDRSGFDEAEEAALGIAQRAELEQEARAFADSLGYLVDWDAVARLDDEMLVNGIAQVAPFDVRTKQALLEAEGIAERADLLVRFMQFHRISPAGADGVETMQ